MSFYRNWHRPSAWYQCKKKSLSDTWRPKAQKAANTMTEIIFTDDETHKQIAFTLNEEQAKNLITQITKIYV